MYRCICGIFLCLMVPCFILAAFHDVSVYPKKELPFFILFTAGLCSFTALLALLTHQYPEPMGVIAKTVSLHPYPQPWFISTPSPWESLLKWWVSPIYTPPSLEPFISIMSPWESLLKPLATHSSLNHLSVPWTETCLLVNVSEFASGQLVI